MARDRSSSNEEAVLQFFREHPVHSCKARAIAGFLGLTEEGVRAALALLIERGLVVERYQFSVKGLKELELEEAK